MRTRPLSGCLHGYVPPLLLVTEAFRRRRAFCRECEPNYSGASPWSTLVVPLRQGHDVEVGYRRRCLGAIVVERRGAAAVHRHVVRGDHGTREVPVASAIDGDVRVSDIEES